MRLIAHRANLYGSDPKTENSPIQILKCIALGFDVEVDVWYIDQQLFLGHDGPQYNIDLDFLVQHKNYLWCHCKHFDSLQYLHQYPDVHIFSHDQDEYTFTSQKWIWCYPGKQAPYNSIIVMPERFPDLKYEKENIGGVCSDYVGDEQVMKRYFY